MLTEKQKKIVEKAVIRCEGSQEECVYAAVEAVLAAQPAAQMVTQPDGEYVTYADHERCKQDLLRLLREWSGTGIADCHCWNTDLRKRTNAALEVK